MSAARVPTLPAIFVNILSQHTLRLVDVKVGHLQLKDQHVHIGCNAVLTLGVVGRVELEGIAARICVHILRGCIPS